MGVMITVAPTGAESRKEDVPALPTTVEEIVATAQQVEAAGAAMIHLHLRDASHEPTLDVGVGREWVAAVRESTDLVVQISTGGAVTDSFKDRLAVLEVEPDSCSVSMGTVNFGDGVFHNPPGFIRDLYRDVRERDIVPEFELFDLGHIESLRRLLRDEGVPAKGRVHCNLVCGVPGGMPGTPQAVMAAASMLPPEVSSWSATGVGRSSVSVLLTALALGGHLRVGMEDTLTLSPGRPVTSNTELVLRAAGLGRLANREPLDPTAAREVLGIAAR